jgi:hypothetical protein
MVLVGWLRQNTRPFRKITWAQGVAQMVEHLCRKYEPMSSNISTSKTTSLLKRKKLFSDSFQKTLVSGY